MRNTFDDFIKLLMDTTNRTREEANEATFRIFEQGRAIIDMHPNASRLLETARTLSQVEVGVTVRRTYDAFREQISVVIIELSSDLTRSRLGTDTHIMREVIASQLLARRRPSTLNPNSKAQKALSVRLDHVSLYHTRLWKRPRSNLKEVYVSILSLSHKHKLAITNSYLHVDREAETSIEYFALHLFTVPSLHIVRQYNVIKLLLSTITSFSPTRFRASESSIPLTRHQRLVWTRFLSNRNGFCPYSRTSGTSATMSPFKNSWPVTGSFSSCFPLSVNSLYASVRTNGG